jgi:hypothetical protein
MAFLFLKIFRAKFPFWDTGVPAQSVYVPRRDLPIISPMRNRWAGDKAKSGYLSLIVKNCQKLINGVAR